MPHERFYCQDELKPNTHVTLSDSESHHLRVLRLTPGSSVELVNGHGTLATASLMKDGSLQILSATTAPLPTPLFSLAIPLMRPSKLEWIVEKGTEIGADAFLFYAADLSEKPSLSPHQLERLHAIAISALKQSGRLHLPTFEFLPHLSAILEREATLFFGDPLSQHSFSPPSENTIFITGPEKGFSKAEMTQLNQKAKGVRLSPYTLRAETAPLVAASLSCLVKD